jgi:hypothetical protein
MESFSPWVLNGNIGSGVLYVFVPLQLTKFVSHTLEVKAMNMLNIAIETRTLLFVTVMDSVSVSTPISSWAPHVQYFDADVPTLKNGEGAGIINLALQLLDSYSLQYTKNG